MLEKAKFQGRDKEIQGVMAILWLHSPLCSFQLHLVSSRNLMD